jgi:hypothetical protein
MQLDIGKATLNHLVNPEQRLQRVGNWSALSGSGGTPGRPLIQARRNPSWIAATATISLARCVGLGGKPIPGNF